MVFKRRTPHGFWDRIRGFVWPRMSLRRVASYYKRRVVRLPGTPHSIAAGFAAGAAVSFTPFMGFHFLLGAAVAYLTRGNLIASALGTLVGNPWTFPLIWVVIYEIGTLVMQERETRVPWNSLSFTYLLDHIDEVLVPMIIGGGIMSIIVFPLFYFPIRIMIQGFRAMRLERQRRRAAARLRKLLEE